MHANAAHDYCFRVACKGASPFAVAKDPGLCFPKVPRNPSLGTNRSGTRNHLDHRILVPAFRPLNLFLRHCLLDLTLLPTTM